MDFHPDAAGEAIRAEARSLFDRLVTEEVRGRVRDTGTIHDKPLHEELSRLGWLTASWPVEDGGQGRSAMEMAPFYEEAYLADAPLVAALTTMLVAESVKRVGSPEQRDTILRGIVDGRVLVCLGLSEPDAGSDVAAARTSAVRDGDEWVIDGQKMFTTMAHDADYVLLLTRTNNEVAKHQGLTMFLIPMDLPGIEVQGVETLGGERTNITFYADVRVPDSCRLGEVDRGWDVLLITLTFERGMVPTAAAQCTRLLGLLERWAREGTGDDGQAPIERAHVRTMLARHQARAEVSRLLGLRSIWTHDRGGMPVVEGSMAKLFASELLLAMAHDAMDVVGPAGVVAEGDDGSVLDGAFEHAYRHSPVESIYGGTSEVQRGIIAGQRLQLPRG